MKSHITRLMTPRCDTPASTLGGETLHDIDLKADTEKHIIFESRIEEGRARRQPSTTRQHCRARITAAEEKFERLSKRIRKWATVYIGLVMMVMIALLATIFGLALVHRRHQECPSCGQIDS